MAPVDEPRVRQRGSLLFGVQPLDALTFAGTCVLMLVGSVLASRAPARRATGVAPSVALRSD